VRWFRVSRVRPEAAEDSVRGLSPRPDGGVGAADRRGRRPGQPCSGRSAASGGAGPAGRAGCDPDAGVRAHRAVVAVAAGHAGAVLVAWLWTRAAPGAGIPGWAGAVRHRLDRCRASGGSSSACTAMAAWLRHWLPRPCWLLAWRCWRCILAAAAVVLRALAVAGHRPGTRCCSAALWLLAELARGQSCSPAFPGWLPATRRWIRRWPALAPWVGVYGMGAVVAGSAALPRRPPAFAALIVRRSGCLRPVALAGAAVGSWRSCRCRAGSRGRPAR
jgi:hypothetical protein